MGTQKIPFSSVEGLNPAVEPSQSDKVFALGGRNYLFDTKGAKSAFGNLLLTPIERTKKNQPQGVRFNTHLGVLCFFMDGDGIWQWDDSLGDYRQIYSTRDVDMVDYRWTYGYLANLIYFCHPSTGILVYDLSDPGYCQKHSQIGNVTPDDAMSIDVTSGRLVVQSPLLMSWSAPGDGLDFNPMLGQGGFQLISDFVPGEPILITSYATGCLTWTTNGVLRSEFTGDQSVFRHRALNTEFHPVNSFCTFRVDDTTVVILDERGLYSSQGGQITSYAPLFSEYLLDFIQKNRLKIGNNLRTEWDALQKRLYVSVSLSVSNPQYEQCFVYYPPVDKWGQFDEVHYGIVPVSTQLAARQGDYYGFVDLDGRVRFWREITSRELRPERANYLTKNLYQPAIPKQVQYDKDLLYRIMPSWTKLSGISKAGMGRVGYYDIGGTAPTLIQSEGLNAQIRIGLLRPNGPGESDQMSEVLNLLVRSTDSALGQQIDDFMLYASDVIEDWQILTGDEDWGGNDAGVVGHTLQVVGTIDGVNDFVRVVPKLVRELPSGRYYSCSVKGVWHIVEIGAQAVGESFALKTLELTAADAGRLL